MDDRLRRDNAENNDKSNSDTSRERDFQQWDFNTNAESEASDKKINPSVQIPKRFEVHIPESEDFPSFMPQSATRVPAPENRPAPAAPVRRPTSAPAASARPAAPGAQRSTRPVPVSGLRQPAPASRSTAKKKTATAKPSAAAGRPAAAKAPDAKKAKPEEAQKAPERKKNRADMAYNFAKGTLITCVCLIFIATLTTVVSSVAFGFINDILVIDDENKSYSVVVEIPEGADYETIFDILTENGLVSQPLLTDFFLKFRHYDFQAAYDDETGELLYNDDGSVKQEAVKYQPGVYYVYADSGIENILDSMLVNNNLNKGTVRLTFPEGWTTAQIFEKIENNGVCEAEKLYANLDIVAKQYGFIEKISDADGRYLLAEGYLFPDTYDFYIGESANSVLEKLFNNFEVKWEKEYNARLKRLGITMDEAIIIASIIQSEAKDGTEMPTISGITYNRLADSASFPTIGMDSTGDYIDLLLSMNIITKEQSDFYRPFYNTYLSQGLPPGPICNPGYSAIKAALYPEETEYKFFCHDNDGEIYYASTASEHEENEKIAIYGSVGGN